MILMLVWIVAEIVFTLATKITVNKETFEVSYKVKFIFTISKIVLGVSFISTLATVGLLGASTGIQLSKTRKNNIKQNSIYIIIGVAVILLLSFLIASVVVYFGKYHGIKKWDYDYEMMLCWMFRAHAYLGIVFALVVFSMYFAKYAAKQTDNYKLYDASITKTVISVGATAFAFIALWAITNFMAKDSKLADHLYLQGSLLVGKFIAALAGTIAIMMLTCIVTAVLSNNDAAKRNKAIIYWSVIGGIALVLFIIHAVMYKSTKEGGIVGWDGNNKDPRGWASRIFVILDAVAALVWACMASVKNKKLVGPKPTTQAA